MFVKFVLEPPKQLCGIYLIHMFQHYIIDFWLSGHIVPSQVGVKPTWATWPPGKHHSFQVHLLELVGMAKGPLPEIWMAFNAGSPARPLGESLFSEPVRWNWSERYTVAAQMAYIHS